MSTPIILVSGPAGCGKDTVASLIASGHNGVCIALADPMKRLAAEVFDFSEQQLWGESSFRNAPDVRYAYRDSWDEAEAALRQYYAGWLAEIGALQAHPETLHRWFRSVKNAHVDVMGNSVRLLTPRYVLQTLGTEWGRSVSSDLWIDVGMRTATRLLAGGPRYQRAVGLTEDIGYHPPDFVLITDGRFRNELLKVQMVGGTTVRIDPGAASDDARKVEAAGVVGHRSEAEMASIPKHFYTFTLVNDKKLGMEHLAQTIDELMLLLKRRATIALPSTLVA